MGGMKCPFCGEKIEHIEDGWCNCKNRCVGSGSISLWQELIRTRKALEIIKKETSNEYMPDFAVIRDALKTALEQKDVK